jgi:AAA domain (dynein-related subfamily)
MKPTKLKTLLATAFAAKQRVLLKGSPGIGKSDIVEQAARECEAELLISHPAVSDPTDYKGMPAVVDGGTRAEFLPFGDLNKLIQAERLTVAFLDDLGQAPPAVQAAVMQLIQARRVNGHKISAHVVFCAATNDTSHMAGVAGLLEPVKSRWDAIVTLEVSVDDWCAWAFAHGMPPELIAFIRFRPQLLNDFKPTREIRNSPCPRTVSAVGRWLTCGVKDHEVIAGAAGEGFATELIGFLAVYAQLPNLDAILLDPDHAALPESPAAKYAVITGLAHRATPQNAEQVFRYVGRLEKEFEVCCVRDCLQREKKITSTPTFAAWATRNATALS